MLGWEMGDKRWEMEDGRWMPETGFPLLLEEKGLGMRWILGQGMRWVFVTIYDFHRQTEQ
jgi:hypothetical protein